MPRAHTPWHWWGHSNARSAQASAWALSVLVHFSVSGLESEDSAVVTFIDSNGGKTSATVTANGIATVDLSGLADGTITAAMQVATDVAGNSFLPVAASNSATLDQDKGEQAALKLTVTTTAISPATAPAVPFTVGGLDAEDSARVTFTDANGKSVQVNVNGGQTSQ